MKKVDIEKIVEKLIIEHEEKKVKNILNYKWDSLMQLNVLLILQKKYKKKISSVSELGSINTLRSLLALLKKYQLLN
jgi:acyl carrier protein